MTHAVALRRLFAELFGTFLLVLAGAGAVVVGAVSHGAVSRPAAVTAPGLTVMAIILFMGGVSGAHLNPGVTLAFTLRGDFPFAAGGIVCRSVDGRLEVAIVHRPRYDDWSFTKGKARPDETEVTCALREAEEETGLRCELGPSLEATTYRDRFGRERSFITWQCGGSGVHRVEQGGR